MKKVFLYLSLALAMTLAAGCVKEKAGPEEKPLVFAEVPVDIGEEETDSPETKSLISIDAERLQKAALFAFRASDGKIIVNGGSPVVKETTSKNFSWSLPLNLSMDIYVIANYGDLDLSAYLSSTTLTESDLEALTFSCSNGTELRQLDTEGYGLPMAGIKSDVVLTSGNTGLNLKVKKLFARYDFYFDAKDFFDAGYTVHALYVSGCKSNTVVPYFLEGYKQTDLSKLNLVDLGTAEDIAELDYASKTHAITLYFLENCQGDKSGAEHWYDVAGSGMSGLNLCSYIDLGIKVTDADGNDSNFFYWIYLGDDCTTNFDVRRNEYRTIKLRLRTPDVVPPTQGITVINPASVMSTTLPGSCSLYFETTLAENQITAAATNGLVTAVTGYDNANERDYTSYPYSGYVVISAPGSHDVSQALSGKVTVGKAANVVSGDVVGWSVSDQRDVSFAAYEPTISYRYKVRTTLSAANMYVGGSVTASAKLYKRTYSDGTPITDWVEQSDNINGSGFKAQTGGSHVSISGTSATVTGVSAGTATVRSKYAADEYEDATVVVNTDGVSSYEYKDVEVFISANPTTIPASGGTSTLSYSATYKRRPVYQSGSKGNWTNQVGTPTINGSATGFTRSGTKVTVDPNTSDNTRSVTYTARFSIGGESATQKSVTITQDGNNIDYYEYSEVEVTISANPTTIPANGGSSTLTVTGTYKQRPHYTNGTTGNWSGTLSGTPTISGSATGFTRSGNNVTVSANTSLSSRSVTYRANMTVGTGEHAVSATEKSVTITQDKDSICSYEYQKVSVSISANPTTIPASGGSSILTFSASYQERAVYVSGNKGNWTDRSGTPNVTGSETGFSREGTSVSIDPNPGEQSRCVTYTASFGIGDQYDEKSVTITQEGNGIDYYEYGEVEVTISANPTIIPASGGSSTLTVRGTYKQRPHYTNGTTGNWSGTLSGTPTISGSATGFSRSGNTVTVARYDDMTSDRSVTYSANMTVGTGSHAVSATEKKASITQTKNGIDHYEYKDLAVNIDANPKSIGKAGGTSTLTPSMTYKEKTFYTNGTSSDWVSRNGTPTISGSATGFSRSGNSVTVSANTGDARSVTYTASGSIGSLNDSASVTINQDAGWKDGFEWIDVDITVDAGSSKTVKYACSSANPTIGIEGATEAGLEVNTPSTSQVSKNGYKYSGSVTVSAASGMTNNASATLRGTSSGASSTTNCTVHNPDVITYQIVFSGEMSGSHHMEYSIDATLKKYVNGVYNSDVMPDEISGTFNRFTWNGGMYSTTIPSQAFYNSCKIRSSEYSSSSSTISARSSTVIVSCTYNGTVYSNSFSMDYRKTYHVSATIEKSTSYGNTSIRAKLSVAVPTKVVVHASYSGGTIELWTNAGSMYSGYDYSISQSDFDSIYGIYCSLQYGEPYYYDDGDKEYFYF